MADTKLVKSAGEHWTCAMLARHGWAPALTRDGLERTDILAVGTHIPYRPTVEVQVKAATDPGRRVISWHLGRAVYAYAASGHEWFVFVTLPETRLHPRAFVVPRDHVCAATWLSHESWRTDPQAAPGKRNAPVSQARVAAEVWAGYEDRWDLLGSETSEVPVLLPAWMHERAAGDRVGLPEGHPWNDVLPQW